MSLPHYTEWADIPENLKTKTSLKKLGLKPAEDQQPVATMESKVPQRSSSSTLPNPSPAAVRVADRSAEDEARQ